MSESVVIQHTGVEPATVDSMASDLADLGITAGQILLVHSSLSSIGWVSGGQVAVIDALEKVLADSGTLVMPTHSSQLSDPMLWGDRAVPPRWINTIRETLPPFDPLVTPTRGMGVIPECFRAQPGVLRSNHPHDSFAARGPQAERIVAEHALHDALGENTPLAALYELDARILLLGVSHDSSTALHLAENRADYPGKHYVKNGAPVTIGNKRQWATIRHLEYEVADFNRLGRAYATETGEVSYGYVGRAQSMLIQMRPMVDYAARWMEQNR